MESQRPSNSAPTSTYQQPQHSTTEVGAAAEFPGEHRSVLDINSRPIEYIPTEELRPLDHPEEDWRKVMMMMMMMMELAFRPGLDERKEG